MSFPISRCTPILRLRVKGVSNEPSTLVGKSWAGIAAWLNEPNGPKKKNPGVLPTAALAWSKNCCGVKPVNDCTLLRLITEFAGMGAWPPATTLLILSIPMNNPALNGHVTFPAVICASVKFGDMHRPPGNNDALIAAGASVGTP